MKLRTWSGSLVPWWKAPRWFAGWCREYAARLRVPTQDSDALDLVSFNVFAIQGERRPVLESVPLRYLFAHAEFEGTPDVVREYRQPVVIILSREHPEIRRRPRPPE